MLAQCLELTNLKKEGRVVGVIIHPGREIETHCCSVWGRQCTLMVSLNVRMNRYGEPNV